MLRRISRREMMLRAVTLVPPAVVLRGLPSGASQSTAPTSLLNLQPALRRRFLLQDQRLMRPGIFHLGRCFSIALAGLLVGCSDPDPIQQYTVARQRPDDTST